MIDSVSSEDVGIAARHAIVRMCFPPLGTEVFEPLGVLEADVLLAVPATRDNEGQKSGVVVDGGRFGVERATTERAASDNAVDADWAQPVAAW